MLNRYSDVDDEGNFVSEIGSGRARFLTVADQLLSGRIGDKISSLSFLRTKFLIRVDFLALSISLMLLVNLDHWCIFNQSVLVPKVQHFFTSSEC